LSLMQTFEFQGSTQSSHSLPPTQGIQTNFILTSSRPKRTGL